MADSFISFQDGPCEFQTVPISQADLTRRKTECGGAEYNVVFVGRGGIAGYVVGGTGAGSGSQAAPDVFAGFHDLQRALSLKLRPALDRARASNQLALRALPRIHKVKGR